ncbi:MAG: hypothetical protein II329_03240, partial [Clostridia bacterium]|nr:hypothetical protein [Clostridia bacterium]
EKPLVERVFHRKLINFPLKLWKTLWELWNNCSDKSAKRRKICEKRRKALKNQGTNTAPKTAKNRLWKTRN